MNACTVINCFPHTDPDVPITEESCLFKDVRGDKAVELNKGLEECRLWKRELESESLQFLCFPNS